MRLLLLITLPLYILDQVTKWLIVLNFPLHSYRTIIPNFFDLVHVTNTGAAFGSFSDSNLFFMALSAVVAAGLLYFYFRNAFTELTGRIGAALLLSGILGNLTDRITHGHVVDFLSFDLHIPFANPWPAFNIADSCICIAAGLFLLHATIEAVKEARAKRE